MKYVKFEFLCKKLFHNGLGIYLPMGYGQIQSDMLVKNKLNKKIEMKFYAKVFAMYLVIYKII